MLNLILQSDVAGKMHFGYERAVNTSHLKTGFANKRRRLFYEKPSLSTSETIEVRKYVSSNGIFKTDLQSRFAKNEFVFQTANIYARN